MPVRWLATSDAPVQAIQYLTLSSEGSAVHWLTHAQLEAVIRPHATSTLAHAMPASGTTPPAFAALRVLDRRAFLLSMAKVESERLWGQKSRGEKAGPPV